MADTQTEAVESPAKPIDIRSSILVSVDSMEVVQAVIKTLEDALGVQLFWRSTEQAGPRVFRVEEYGLATQSCIAYQIMIPSREELLRLLNDAAVVSDR